MSRLGFAKILSMCQERTQAEILSHILTFSYNKIEFLQFGSTWPNFLSFLIQNDERWFTEHSVEIFHAETIFLKKIIRYETRVYNYCIYDYKIFKPITIVE